MKIKSIVSLLLLTGFFLSTYSQPAWLMASEYVQNTSPIAYDLSRVMVRMDQEKAGPEIVNRLDEAVELGLIKGHTYFPGYEVSLVEMNKTANRWVNLTRDLYEALDKLSAGPDGLTPIYHIESASPCYRGPNGEFAALYDRLVIKIVPGGESAMMSEIRKWDRVLGLGTPEPAEWCPNTWILPLQGHLPGYIWWFAPKFADHPAIEFAYPDFLFSPTVTTNDTFYSYQWALNNTGSAIQFNGTAGSDIDIEQAWTISHGDSSLVIAVLDSGVDTLHPDLTGKLLPGYDATPQDLRGYPNTDYPQNAHGTACSGIAAAWSENGEGIAGVAPGCLVMPVRVFYYVDIPGQGIQPFATSTVFAEGIDYAWQNGADVLSNSWGIPDWLLGLLPNQNLIEDAMKNCHDQGRNGLGAPMLFSSGNEGDPPIWPGRLEDGITVNATSMCDEWKNAQSCDGENWWSGNWGGNLDFSAPGVKIYTCDMTDTLGYEPGNYTPDFNGTSAACPHAAGVAALILSIRPDLSFEEVRYIMGHSAERVGGYNYSFVKIAGYWSTRLGYGRINAYRALQEAQTFDSIPAVGIEELEAAATRFAVYPNPTTGKITVEWEQPLSSELTWALFDLTGKEVWSRPSAWTAAGLHRSEMDFFGLPAGLYLLKGKAPGISLKRKIVLN